MYFNVLIFYMLYILSSPLLLGLVYRRGYAKAFYKTQIWLESELQDKEGLIENVTDCWSETHCDHCFSTFLRFVVMLFVFVFSLLIK